jgi:hypothetical protein
MSASFEVGRTAVKVSICIKPSYLSIIRNLVSKSDNEGIGYWVRYCCMLSGITFKAAFIYFCGTMWVNASILNGYGFFDIF